MKIKLTSKAKPKIGDLTLITKYHDRDIEDPWAFGKLIKIELIMGYIFYFVEGSERGFKNAFKITENEIVTQLQDFVDV
jgi:hypothetical protein